MNTKIKYISLGVLIAIASLMAWLTFTYPTAQKLGATVLFPSGGGTGIGNTTAGNVGNCLKVSSSSPFTYTLGTCGAGGSGFTNTTTTVAGLNSDILLATSSDTNIHLRIATSGQTITFTPVWIGTLADGRIASAVTWNAKQDGLTFPLAYGSTTHIGFPIPVASTSLTVSNPIVLTTNALSFATSVGSGLGTIAGGLQIQLGGNAAQTCSGSNKVSSITATGTITCTSVSASPGGSDTQIQFNNGGSFGGDANFTWASSTKNLTINGTSTVNGAFQQVATYVNASTTGLALFSNTATANTVLQYKGLSFSFTGTDGDIDPQGEIGVDFITSMTSGNTAGTGGVINMTGVKFSSTFTKSIASLPVMDVVSFNGYFNNAVGTTGDTLNLASFNFENQAAAVTTIVNGLNFTAPVLTAGSITTYTAVKIADLGGQVVIDAPGATDKSIFGGRMMIGLSGTLPTIGGALSLGTGGISPAQPTAGTVLPIMMFLTNKSGGTSVAGDLYIYNTALANSVTTSTVASSTLVACVARTVVTDGSVMGCAFWGQTGISATGTVAIGDRLCTSIYAGKAASCNSNPTFGAVIGRATAARSGSPATSIKAIIGVQ